MQNKVKSREHHWWPVALQKHWCDRFGDVFWINPDGKIEKKKAKNEKIGRKSHGHTMFRGSHWENNFESEFDIDNNIHTIVASLKELKPVKRSIFNFSFSQRLRNKNKENYINYCNFYYLGDALQRNILLLIYSLLIRSPANRARSEGYSNIIGLQSNAEVGKTNMRKSYLSAKELCQEGVTSNQYFVLLHSKREKFIFGDGMLDWLSSEINGLGANGRCLIPLTPELCIYFCTPSEMLVSPNCAALSAEPWMVDRVNYLTQIYSKDYLFFLGDPPKLREEFRQREFLEHNEKSDILIDTLDEIAGIGKARLGSMFL